MSDVKLKRFTDLSIEGFKTEESINIAISERVLNRWRQDNSWDPLKHKEEIVNLYKDTQLRTNISFEIEEFINNLLSFCQSLKGKKEVNSTGGLEIAQRINDKEEVEKKIFNILHDITNNLSMTLSSIISILTDFSKNYDEETTKSVMINIISKLGLELKSVDIHLYNGFYNIVRIYSGISNYQRAETDTYEELKLRFLMSIVVYKTPLLLNFAQRYMYYEGDEVYNSYIKDLPEKELIESVKDVYKEWIIA